MSSDAPLWWKMNAGDNGELKDAWLDGIVSIGWDVGDFQELTDEEIIKTDNSEKHQLSKFVGANVRDESMSVGDIVIAYAPKPVKELIGVGVVGEARYDPEADLAIDHPNLRSIEWYDSALPLPLDEVPDDLRSGKNKVVPTHSLERFRGNPDLFSDSSLNVDFDSVEPDAIQDRINQMDVEIPMSFRKLTGPIEHWLTTYHTGYWGFRPDKEEAWKDIEVGDVFLFHASKSEFLDVPTSSISDVPTGVIGLGKVGAKSTKSEPAWWEEIHSNGNYPYLIHFSEIHWFGNVGEIRDVPVSEKNTDEMVRDIHQLVEDIITFSEMREDAGYQIPAQGSPGNIKQPGKLFPLIRKRLEGDIESGTSAEPSQDSTGTGIRERSGVPNIDDSSIDEESVEYTPSIAETISGTIEHEETLDAFENELETMGFTGGETDYSDLILHSDSHVILGEAKSIHNGNERSQIRRGVGQLLEYRHVDIEQNQDLAELTQTLCLILSQKPTDDYRDVLESFLDKGIHTYWIENGEVTGLEESMTHLRSLAN